MVTPDARHLLGGHQLVHGRDDHPRRGREPLVQHVRLLQVQVAVAVPGRGVQQRHVRAQRRHRDQRLPGERAGDLRVLGVQPDDVRARGPRGPAGTAAPSRPPAAGPGWWRSSSPPPRSCPPRRPAGTRGPGRGPARTRRSFPRTGGPPRRPPAGPRRCCAPTRPGAGRVRRCRTSSRTMAMGSRADRPPPSATIAPSLTSDTASARLARLSPGGCRLMGILQRARRAPGRP